MKRGIIDTSALVSLSLIGLLENAANWIDLIVPLSVVEEIEDISKFSNSEGKAAKQVLELINKGKINKIGVDKKRVKLLSHTNIDEGEASCFVACVENKINLLIIDDIDAAYSLQEFAKKEKIDIKISVAIIVDLLRRKKINKEQAETFIKKLVKIRRWEGGILEFLTKKYLGKL